MKIRLDYVSNSSSSSFMLVGTAVETEELKESFKNSQLFKQHMQENRETEDLKETEEDKVEREWEELNDVFWSYIDEWLEKYGLDYHNGLENYGECVCIGMKYNDMQADETKAQFEKRVSDALEKLLGAPQKVECMVDGGYDS